MKKLIASKVFWSAVIIGLLVVVGALNLKTDTRPECQKAVTTFEKWSENRALIYKARSNLQAGNYELKVRQIFSEYMPSDLNGTFENAQLDALMQEAIGTLSNPQEGALTIDYRLVENDKYDPRKKNPPKKPFSGYLLVSFKQDKQEIYRIQIDYLDPKAADLKERIECAFISFKNPRD